MLEILTAQINEEIYHLFVCHRLFPEQQEGCHRGTRGTGELLFIGYHIIKEQM